MKALICSSLGPAENLTVTEVEAPTAGRRRALAAQIDTAAIPMARRDERTKRVITNNPLNRARALWPVPDGGFPAIRSGQNSGLAPCRPTQGLQSCIWLLKNE